ncbi:MAG: BamA/TamA family outer membrane protein [Spirochaetia bacterium]|nr:BamA/TamA family outer membrane protein [Spirochaetia bacterium]
MPIFRVFAALLAFSITSSLLQARSLQLSDDDLARKKEGLYVVGLPFANYNTDFGFGIGGGAYLFQNGKRLLPSGETNAAFRTFPHEVRVGLQLYITTLGQQKHFLNVDVPRLFIDQLSFSAEFAYLRVLADNYFGVGNNSAYGDIQTLIPTNFFGVPVLALSNFYKLTTDQPYLQTKFSFSLPFDFYLLGALRAKYVLVTSRNGVKLDNGAVVGQTLFDIEKPYGSKAGWANSFQLGASFDKRDFTPYPTRGVYVRFLWECFPAGLSDYAFNRLSLDTETFLQIAKPLVWANRIFLQQHFGQVPFTELSSLGGNAVSRGYLDRRFIDQAVFLVNTELRFRFAKWKWGTEHFDLAAIPFLDLGQVSPALFSADTFKRWRLSTGLELLLTWNLNTHLNLTAGFSEEGFSSALDTRIMF